MDYTVRDVRRILKKRKFDSIKVSVKVTNDDVATMEISKNAAINLYKHFGSNEKADVAIFDNTLWIG